MLRPRLHAAALAALLLATVACGDSRLKDLSIGMGRDSLNLVMQTDQPHRTESYFLEGKLWEVHYSSRKAVATDDTIPWRELSPVILADGKVAGWGWDYWDREAAKLNVPVPGKE